MEELWVRRRDGTRLIQNSGGSQKKAQQLSQDVFYWLQTLAVQYYNNAADILSILYQSQMFPS